MIVHGYRCLTAWLLVDDASHMVMYSVPMSSHAAACRITNIFLHVYQCLPACLSVSAYIVTNINACQCLLPCIFCVVTLMVQLHFADHLVDVCLQVRNRLPHLKAIVQYKGKLRQKYPNVYEVTHIHAILYGGIRMAATDQLFLKKKEIFQCLHWQRAGYGLFQSMNF